MFNFYGLYIGIYSQPAFTYSTSIMKSKSNLWNMPKVNNKESKKKSKRESSVFIVYFEHNSLIVLILPLLILKG